MATFKAFVLADDDVNDLLDVSEFRKAATDSGLRFTEEQEAEIFEAAARAAGRDAGQDGGSRMLPVFEFLDHLMGLLNEERRELVNRAWEKVTEGAVGNLDGFFLRIFSC